ncbi:putative GTP-binding protein YPTC4 [Blattamonas nauphoetae]|uniref:GTP-binding protein YPTC4 n=1 Tax=Blattamonas nauphoetae TaxID=2049346 RepID=A0ABQ9XI03_9EUKA|nr:putative GTP-binding protein YPTC4 [Blattamonas nauphoetae]
MDNEDYDYQIKIVVIGETQVGKSSLLLRFVDDTFDPHQPTTIGVDFRAKQVDFRGRNVRLTVWDTAGQERFRTLTSSYYRGAAGVILVYDISRKPTFDILNKWLAEARDSIGDSDAVVMLVGNKSDIEDRQVTTDEAQTYAKRERLLFVEASAKESKCVDQAFLETLEKVFDQPALLEKCLNPLKKTSPGQQSTAQSDVVQPQSSGSSGEGGGCGFC